MRLLSPWKVISVIEELNFSFHFMWPVASTLDSPGLEGAPQGDVICDLETWHKRMSLRAGAEVVWLLSFYMGNGMKALACPRSLVCGMVTPQEWTLTEHFMQRLVLCCAVLSCSVMSDSATPWTIALQDPLLCFKKQFSGKTYEFSSVWEQSWWTKQTQSLSSASWKWSSSQRNRH